MKSFVLTREYSRKYQIIIEAEDYNTADRQMSNINDEDMTLIEDSKEYLKECCILDKPVESLDDMYIFERKKFGDEITRSIEWFLDHVNADRSAEWEDYELEDWRDGLEWSDYRLVSKTKVI